MTVPSLVTPVARTVRTPAKPGPGPTPEALLRALDVTIGRRIRGLVPGEFRAHDLLTPVDDEADVGTAGRDRHERRNNHGWSVIAAHGIDGNPDHAVFISRLGGRSL